MTPTPPLEPPSAGDRAYRLSPLRLYISLPPLPPVIIVMWMCLVIRLNGFSIPH